MAKTSYLTIPDELKDAYKAVLQSGDRFEIPRVALKPLFTSRARKKGLTQRSLMVQLLPDWQGFSPEVRDAWSVAGAASNMSGWKQFIQDTARRRANDLPGFADPSPLYQSMVGRMRVEAPAVGLKIMQLHPNSYYVLRKVTGTRAQYNAVPVYEAPSLPIQISISYKSALESAGDSPRARFFLTLFSNYQGRDIETPVELSFDLESDWQRISTSVSNVLGLYRGYTAYIEIQDARGDLWFDNVSIVHSAQNWARDPYCNSIQTTFTKAFYQIPRNWIADALPEGTFYRSVYHETE